MRIIINTSSMIQIYDQIVDTIKISVKDGRNNLLLSVRSLSKELKISALTVKKLMIV